MGEWIIVAAAELSAILATAAAGVIWIYKTGKHGAAQEAARHEKMTAIQETLRRHSEHHIEHYQHQRDDNAHWTKRERDDLTRKLEEIHKDIKAIPRRMYGDAE